MTVRRLSLGACALILSACGNSQLPTGNGSLPAPEVLACTLDQLTEAEILAVARTPADAPLADLSHYQARNAPRSAAAVLNGGACQSNTQFRYAAGLGDITGATSGSSMAGYVDPDQVSTGLIDRQHARAFAFESNCGGRTGRAVIVQLDIGLSFHSIRQGVLDAIAADPALSLDFNANNVLLNASHSHSTAAGQSHFDAYHVLTGGHDAQNLAAAVSGVVAAIRRAHTHLQTATPGPIRFAQGELLNGTVQRSLPAFVQNPEAERLQFLDTRGEPVRTNRMMSLLRLQRDDGTAVGMVNWYPIHGTSIWQLNTKLSGDNKGYAAYRSEIGFGTDYPRAYAGEEQFLAGYMQADEGDASPNPYIVDLSEAELRDLESQGFRNRAGGRDEPENALISGYKQFRHAGELYAEAEEQLEGEVRAASILIDMTSVQVDAPRSYAAELQPVAGETYATCNQSLGVSFAAGAEDGRGPSAEGQTCGNTSQGDVEATVALLEQAFEDGQGGALPPGLIVPAGCDNPIYDAKGYACQAEKPIVFTLADPSPFLPTQTLEPSVQALQLVILGNLAIIALPWEVTTTSGRRIRNAVLDALQDAGVDYAVISGLSNGFIHYLTTREEFSVQHYEGASTVYGPWSQEAVQQELVRLAAHLRDGSEPQSPFAVSEFRSQVSSYTNPMSADDGSGAFGDVVQQPLPEYQISDQAVVVTVRFVAAHPRRNLRLESSYVYVERMAADGSWSVVQTDADWFLRFDYEPMQDDGSNHLLVEWQLPAASEAGRYRIRHEGESAAGPYTGISEPFDLLPCAD